MMDHTLPDTAALDDPYSLTSPRDRAGLGRSNVGLHRSSPTAILKVSVSDRETLEDLSQSP